jgi:hypothetical protein
MSTSRSYEKHELGTGKENCGPYCDIEEAEQSGSGQVRHVEVVDTLQVSQGNFSRLAISEISLQGGSVKGGVRGKRGSNGSHEQKSKECLKKGREVYAAFIYQHGHVAVDKSRKLRWRKS